jgi:hypothetical protein
MIPGAVTGPEGVGFLSVDRPGTIVELFGGVGNRIGNLRLRSSQMDLKLKDKVALVTGSTA